MRSLIFALALTAAFPAAAQTPPPQNEMAQVARMLGAIWRPLPPSQPGQQRATAEAACVGANEEMNAVSEVVPEDLSSPALNSIRASRGFVIVNSADIGEAYFFPNAELGFITPGPGQFAITDRAQGRVDLTDSAGATIPVQIGASGGLPLMRILRPNATPLTFVGCASTGNPGG
ncbi:hypothetical protein U91I_03207 [alpha proteobacterium U9-1i]|nr:hypothetical protein U91I_03207 [alpha proteobacterium U9-1i]